MYRFAVGNELKQLRVLCFETHVTLDLHLFALLTADTDQSLMFYWIVLSISCLLITQCDTIFSFSCIYSKFKINKLVNLKTNIVIVNLLTSINRFYCWHTGQMIPHMTHERKHQMFFLNIMISLLKSRKVIVWLFHKAKHRILFSRFSKYSNSS